MVGAVPVSGMWVGFYMAGVKSQGQSWWRSENDVATKPQTPVLPHPRALAGSAPSTPTKGSSVDPSF